MRVLLLYPRFPETFWSLHHALRFVRKRAALPPLGLLTVAGMLPSDWQLRLVDTNVETLRESDLRWADLAMISAMGVQREAARELIDRCKRVGLKVVAGGPLFTAEPEAFEDVDHLVLGEAEVSLPPFLVDYAGGVARHAYVPTGFADVSTTPLPRWDLLRMERYFSMGVQFSRGCPFNCEFCNVTTLFGRKPRLKSARQVVSELESLERAGWGGNVFFVDDNLIGNKLAARTELLPALIEWRADRPGRTMSYNTQASINVADDPEMLSLLRRAGFETIFVGIETPDNDSLVECGKVQNRRRDMVEDVKTIQRAGIEVQGGFIVGFDSDGPSIFQRQIDFIQASGVVTAMVGLLNALPGTALYVRLRSAGRLLGSGTGDNVDGTTNIVPTMNAEHLREGYRKILRTIYSPSNYYQRLRTFLREYHPPRVRRGIGRADWMAFMRSLVMLGVLGRERFNYWHLLIWTLVRRPRLLPRAVTLAITGHHFRRVCDRCLRSTHPKTSTDA